MSEIKTYGVNIFLFVSLILFGVGSLYSMFVSPLPMNGADNVFLHLAAAGLMWFFVSVVMRRRKREDGEQGMTTGQFVVFFGRVEAWVILACTVISFNFGYPVPLVVIGVLIMSTVLAVCLAKIPR